MTAAGERAQQVEKDLLDDELEVHRPTEVAHRRHRFDHVADLIARVVGREPFFLVCLGALVLWGGIGLAFGFSDKWLWTGSLTMSIVTFLLLNVLENMQRRSDQALHRKLNTIASALAELGREGRISEAHDAELRAAVGLERRESTHNHPRRKT